MRRSGGTSSRKRWVDTHVIGTQTRRETQEGDVEYQVRESNVGHNLGNLVGDS